MAIPPRNKNTLPKHLDSRQNLETFENHIVPFAKNGTEEIWLPDASKTYFSLMALRTGIYVRRMLFLEAKLARTAIL